MDALTLATPTLLFPAISLLMLAYTNRFLALASVIRALHARYEDSHEPRLRDQIAALRVRVELVRNMQALAVTAIFCCMACMLSLFLGLAALGKVFFILGLTLMMSSLAFSLREVQLSVNALNLLLQDLDAEDWPGKRSKTLAAPLDADEGSG